MPMVCKNDSKNIRNVFYADNKEVLACSATFSERSITFMVERLNKDYCDANKAEVQEAITGFMARVNAALDEASLPMLESK